MNKQDYILKIRRDIETLKTAIKKIEEVKIITYSYLQIPGQELANELNDAINTIQLQINHWEDNLLHNVMKVDK